MLMPMLRLLVPQYPLAKLFQYAAGTSTKQNTYTTKALAVANANPLIADANGLFATVYLDAALAYKFVLSPSTDTDPPVAPIYTVDNANDASSQTLAVLSKAANYTVLTTDGDDVLILCDASAGSFTLSLYAAATTAGKKVRIVKTDSSVNTVTIDPNGSETIFGQTTYVLMTQYEGISLMSDGSGWTAFATPARPTRLLAKTADYTVTIADGDDVTILIDATAGNKTVTLYTAVGNTGRRITVKKTDATANTVTIDPNGAQTIDGAATVVLGGQYATLRVQADGANWESRDGAALTGAGVVTAPPHSFQVDPDTGMYRSAANSLDFATGGVKALGIDSTQFVDSPTQPRCRVRKTSTDTVTNESGAIAFDTEDTDVGAIHSGGTVTIPTGGDGFYLITARTYPAATASNNTKTLRVKKSNVTMAASVIESAAGLPVPTLEVTIMLQMVATETITVTVDGGGTSTVFGSATLEKQTMLHVVKLW